VKVTYFVHNLGDPATARRIRMLEIGGCREIVPLGFRRTEGPVRSVAGVDTIDLGRTVDGGFGNRILGVALAATILGRHADRFAGSAVLVGRNLEGLMLAALARRRFAPGARLVYECLDIHRLLLGGPARPALGGLERRLLRGTDLVLVSSQAYETEYFRHRLGVTTPVLLVENKVLDDGEAPAQPSAWRPRPAGPPWRIGWYGSLRDHESLDLLAALARRLGGLVEVHVAGRPSEREMPDFHAVVNRTPHMVFHGAYDRARDLPRLYGDAHFTWAIERFEKGGNGAWQLVNRLYEGGLFGSVMIAEAGVEMGRWLAARGTGVLVGASIEDDVARFFRSLGGDAYARLEAEARAVPRTDLVATRAECEDVVAALAGRPRLADPARLTGVPPRPLQLPSTT
jgi:succinoglycan biosynthesis protein ExoL